MRAWRVAGQANVDPLVDLPLTFSALSTPAAGQGHNRDVTPRWSARRLKIA